MLTIVKRIKTFVARYVTRSISDIDLRYYRRFEKALKENNLEVNLLQNVKNIKRVVIVKDQKHHNVTPENLIGFKRIDNAKQ